MNDARFSMRLPQATLEFAQEYAAQCQMTLTDLVLRYFDRLKNGIGTQPSEKCKIRDIHRYRGIIKSSQSTTDEELDAARFKYLSEKYA